MKAKNTNVLLSSLWKTAVLLGLIMLAGALSGVLIPFTLKLLKIDPALASSIFVTTVTDIGAFFFFLGLATLTLHMIGV